MKLSHIDDITYSLEDFIRDTGLNGVSKSTNVNNNLLLKEVTIEKKKDYTNYTWQDFSKDTGLNGVDQRVSGFNKINYAQN